jgi:lantibiotic modifying enzyme
MGRLTTSHRRYADTARVIARHLAATAIAHDGLCTWMGTRQHVDDESEALVFTYESSGPDLYAGAAGVGLFLAEAARCFDDDTLGQVARQAVRFSVDHHTELAGPARFGLYTGALGVAYAAARAARALDDRTLHADSAAITDRLLADLESPYTADLLSGAAGGIPALLVLSDWYARDDWIAAAARLGDRIIAAATRDHGEWSWGEAATGIDSARNLTGFSHGAAGIGYGMIELYRRTGEPRFLECALGAFRYERRWFRPDQDNWPDFRDEDGVEEPAPCLATWCHGAPGIALSRLTAVQSCEDDALVRDLQAAVRTTKRVLREPHAPDADFSLCHGRAGLAECLLLAGDVAGDGEARATALATADRGIDAFGSTPAEWPCGVRRGRNPSLMLGLAGIGYFYLRLADPSLPSLLLVRPEAARASAGDRSAARASST